MTHCKEVIFCLACVNRSKSFVFLFVSICPVFQGKSLISKRLPATVQSCWASNNPPRMRTLSSSFLSSDWSRSQIHWPGQRTKSHACPRDWIFTSVSTCYLLVSVFKTVRHGLLIFGKCSDVFQKRENYLLFCLSGLSPTVDRSNDVKSRKYKVITTVKYNSVGTLCKIEKL